MELANGKYPAKARQWAMGETTAGNPQTAVLFDLTGELAGTSITWYGYFTEKTTKSTIEALRTAGFKSADLSEMETIQPGEDAPEVMLVVENEQAQNEDGTPALYEDGNPVLKPRVRWVNAAGGGNLSLKAPMQGDKLKAFAAQMKEKMLAHDLNKPQGPSAKPTPKPASRPAPAPTGSAPEDLPF